MSDFVTLDLTETGTRLEHYNELREVFMVAVEMLKNLHPAHRSDSDDAQQKRFQNAADAIQGRNRHPCEVPLRKRIWQLAADDDRHDRAKPITTHGRNRWRKRR